MRDDGSIEACVWRSIASTVVFNKGHSYHSACAAGGDDDMGDM